MSRIPKCPVCGELITDIKKSVRFNAIERGNRPQFAHGKCIALAREDCADTTVTELVGVIPKLKDITTSLRVSVSPKDDAEFAAVVVKMDARHGKSFSKPHSKAVALYEPDHPSLKAPINFVNRTLPAIGVKTNSAVVKFSTGKVWKFYSTRSFHPELKSDLPQWVRVAEDDFCNLIGCGEWSALKTGTRKK